MYIMYTVYNNCNNDVNKLILFQCFNISNSNGSYITFSINCVVRGKKVMDYKKMFTFNIINKEQGCM